MKKTELKEWLELGWDKKQAKRWSKAGWDSPVIARAWYILGWDDARYSYLFYNAGWSRTSITAALEWFKAGWKEYPKDACCYYMAGWDDPVEAYIYKFFKRYDYPVKRDKILKNKNGGNKNEI